MKLYYVYILTNYNKTVFYVGITNNLARRAYEHNNELFDGFTKKYKLKYLLYYEVFNDVNLAITREKTLKHWKKEWKWNLIKKANPDLDNLYDEGNIIPLKNDNAYV
jgi:putative endonuclease